MLCCAVLCCVCFFCANILVLNLLVVVVAPSTLMAVFVNVLFPMLLSMYIRVYVCARLSIQPFLNGTLLGLVDVSNDVITFIIRMNKMPKTLFVYECELLPLLLLFLLLYSLVWLFVDTRRWECWFFLMLIWNNACFFSFRTLLSFFLSAS